MKKLILSNSSQGGGGRFGNQLFGYMFTKKLAEMYGAEFQWPEDSNLRKIFKINDPIISSTNFISAGTDCIPTKKQLDIMGHIDVGGYYQFQDALIYTRSEVLQWLRFQDWVSELWEKLPTYNFVIHKRRGDYVGKPDMYCNITDEYFDNIINKIKNEASKIGEPIPTFHIITEENPTKDEYCESIGCILPDWLLMTKAGCTIRSNSTFSWWAPVFGNNIVISPVVGELTGWQTPSFVSGNWPVMAPPSKHAQFNVKLTDLYLKD